MDEDLWCVYTPQGGAKIVMPVETEEDLGIHWSPEAQTRLERLPYFLQKMIKKRVEKSARESGHSLVTLALMEELRKKTFGNAAPIFDGGKFKGLQ